MKNIHILLSLAFACTAVPSLTYAQRETVQIASMVETASSTANLAFTWDKRQDYEAITEQCRKLVREYPGLVEMESIGESAKGKRIWALTISNFNVGSVPLKPGFLVEGNTLQDPGLGADHALYLAWHLLNNHATDAKISKLLEQKVIYIIPITFPDAQLGQTPFAYKSYVPSLDDDHDGRTEEDGPDDLTNDGSIVLIRRKSPSGKYIQDAQNPLKLVLAPNGTKGIYEWLGYEGFDNDKDGLVNEDPYGYHDTDKDWAWQWQPSYGATSGSSAYPFSIPENRALKDFINKRPNIAAAQLQYTTLETETMTLQETHLNMAGLSQGRRNVHAGGHDLVSNTNKWKWFKHAKGLHAFSVQIFTPEHQGAKDTLDKVAVEASMDTSERYHDWTPFEHPTYGPVEIGGLQVLPKMLPQDKMLVRDLERFAQSTVFNAMQLPQLTIQKVECSLLKDGLVEVTAIVHNSGLMATHTTEDLFNKIERADYITLKEGVVLASSINGNGVENISSASLTPNRVQVPNMPINASIQIKWVVKPTSPTMLLEVDSRKGGVVNFRF